MDRRLFLHAGVAAALAAGTARAQRPDTGAAPAAVADLIARQLPDLQGRPQALSQWRGRPMVVNFWATWCAPCVKEMPELDDLQKQHPKVQFVGIGIDKAENIAKFVQKVPVSYPLLVMGGGAIDLLRKLGNPAGGLPFTLVFNADGSVNRKILGQIHPDDLRRTLAGLAA